MSTSISQRISQQAWAVPIKRASMHLGGTAPRGFCLCLATLREMYRGHVVVHGCNSWIECEHRLVFLERRRQVVSTVRVYRRLIMLHEELLRLGGRWHSCAGQEHQQQRCDAAL